MRAFFAFSRQRQRSGFTLVELLVVIAIIGMLVGLLLPSIQAAREAGRRMACQSNMHQIGVALQIYDTTIHGWPAGYETAPQLPQMGPPDPTTNDAGPGWTVFMRLLPYIDQAGLYDHFQLNQPAWSVANTPFTATGVASYLCPSATNIDPTYPISAPDGTLVNFSRSNYVANAGQLEMWDNPGDWSTIANGPFFRNSHTRSSQVTDGLSSTVFMGEQTPYHCDTTWVAIVPGSHTCPAKAFAAITDCDFAAPQVLVHSGPSPDEEVVVIHPPNAPIGRVDGMWSEHPRGCNILFGDSHVRFVPADIDQTVWWYLSTMNGGESASVGDIPD